MRFEILPDLASLGGYLPRFLTLVGEGRWVKRAEQLDVEQQKSPFRWKIVADYHWLEMAISYQNDVLSKEGHLLAELVDNLILAALTFAAMVVEVHTRLSEKGQRELKGRLIDGLKAESGFAALYLEFDIARQLMLNGFDVGFPDMEGRAQFDLEYGRGEFKGEVECKSLSADAGRQIHRKDFYRFMEAIYPMLAGHVEALRKEVLIITLRGRLTPNTSDQSGLRNAIANMLSIGAPTTITQPKFQVERRSYAECLASAPTQDPKAFYAVCKEAFGPHAHVAGGMTEDGGCLVVMRSEREDDTSKPLLEAMRKAMTQFSGARPSFIAVQFQDIEAADLMLVHLRRRVGILSYALFCHYCAEHVNATYFCGFSSVLVRDGEIGTPAFAVPNPKPKYAVSGTDAAPFLLHIPDPDYAAIIGAPLPAPNISYIPFGGVDGV